MLNQIASAIHRRRQRMWRYMRHICGRCFGFPKLRYYCPACEQKIIDWVPFERGIGGGETAREPEKRLCPLCRSFERTRHFALYIERNGFWEAKPRVLHFAPEKSLEPRLRERLGDRYMTTDLFMRGVDRKEDITRMNIDDGSFDFIYCSNVLEHIEDDTAAMRELYRILAPGGLAIIQVPIRGKTTYENWNITDPRERYRHFGQEDHVRYYGEDIQDRLTQAGFNVEPFYMVDELGLSDADIEWMNVSRRELIFRCVKA